MHQFFSIVHASIRTRRLKFTIVLAGVAMLVTSVGLLAQTSGLVRWGYRGTPDAVARAAAGRERTRYAVDPLLRRLSPDQDNELDLEVELGADGLGHRGLRISSRMADKTAEMAHFWAVDTEALTYFAIPLTNTEDDVQKIRRYVVRRGLNVSASTIRLTLAEDAAMRALRRAQQLRDRRARRQAAASRPQAGLLAAFIQKFWNAVSPTVSADESCQGNVEGGIKTYDPVFITLTDTSANAYWERDGEGFWSEWLGGYCYANPETIGYGFTTWYPLRCDGVPRYFDWGLFEAWTSADYENYDFGSPSSGTWVYQDAWAGRDSISPYLRTWHYDAGEGRTYIWGSRWQGLTYDTCPD